MRSTIAPHATIKTDEWNGYKPLKTDFAQLAQVKSGKKGENFPQIHRAIMNLKSWLRGMHGHAQHLQSYIDEYCYRFNRHKMKRGIFENSLNRLIITSPITHKEIYFLYA